VKNLFVNIIVFITCIAAFTSCNIINPKEPTPYFIQIDSVQFSGTDYAKYGSTASKKITDVWVYYENNLLGAFELPARVPIIPKANTSVDIRAGIYDNGISGTKNVYPFYDISTHDLDKPSGTVQKIIPQFHYIDAMKMLYNFDFESGNPFSARTLGTDSAMSYTSTQVYEGSRSGIMYLDNAHPVNENIINELIYLEKNQPYYFELNYKCDTDFEIYLLSKKNGAFNLNYVGGVKTKDTWNKIYFNIGSINSTIQADAYQIIIRAALKAGATNNYVAIDNFKLIGPKL
jgi:hypothetical protein